MKKIFLLLNVLYLWGIFSYGQSSSATYTAGDIQSDFGFTVLPGASACPGSLIVTIPAGVTITGVDVVYDMTALGGGWTSEQLSQLRCISTGGADEATLAYALGNQGGTISYSRTGLNIANGVTGETEIIFELHAGRKWGGSGCSDIFNKVDNNTWTVTVHHTIHDAPGAPINPNPANNSIDVPLSGSLTWDFGDDSDNYDLWFGSIGSMVMVVENGIAGYSGSYDYSGLAEYTNYQWQVISKNANATVPGPVWYFRTELVNGIIAVYTDGDIPTDFQHTWYIPSSCPGVMTLTIPAGHWVTGMDVLYNMTAANEGWMYEQRSRIYSPTLDDGEFLHFSGVGGEGTFNYSRTGLTFANFAKGDITFHLDAMRVWSNTPPNDGCGTFYNKVDNNTWTMVIYTELMPSCPDPITISHMNLSSSSVDLEWTPYGNETVWELKYGSPGFELNTEGTIVSGILTNVYTLGGLSQFTSYDVYVRADCGVGDYSQWIGPTSFTTLIDYDLAISIISPQAAMCYEVPESVTVAVTNYGTLPVNTPFIVSYTIDGVSTVSETININGILYPFWTRYFTFATTISMPGSNDFEFYLNTAVSLANDLNPANDEMGMDVVFYQKPPSPVGIDATITAGASAVLEAISAYDVNWYEADDPDNINVLHTGAIFTTPVLYSSTPYYAAAVTGVNEEYYVGPVDIASHWGSESDLTHHWLIFDVLNPPGINLLSVDVYFTASIGSQFVITVHDAAGSLLDSYTGLTAVTDGQLQTVDVNFFVPSGQNYSLRFETNPGAFRSYAGAFYPYTLPNALTITGNTFDSQYYYWFYNWKVTTRVFCQSERTEVWALIPEGTIEGFVTKAGRSFVEGARVYSGDYESLTDANGYYLISDIPQGIYVFIADADGFEPKTIENVEVIGSQTTTLHFSLDFAEIVVDPQSFFQTVVPTGLASQTLTISNPGGSVSLIWSADILYAAEDGWLLLDPVQGVVDPDMSQDIILYFDSGDLIEGTFHASIILDHNGQEPVRGELVAPVTFEVLAANPPAQASDPSPLDNADNISIQPTFSWTSGAGTTTTQISIFQGLTAVYASDFFFGNTFNLVGLVPPVVLEGNQTYNWIITGRNGAGDTQGPAWVFSTVGIGQLQGTITEGYSSLPVEGALVEVIGTEKTAFTNTSGHYSIAGLPVGTYIVTILKDGYVSTTTHAVIQHAQTVTVDAELFQILYPVTNLQATVVDVFDVHLSWDAPVLLMQSGELSFYIIYKNDIIIGTTINTTFIDPGLSQGTYTYGVTAVYAFGDETGESEPVTAVVDVICFIPTNLYAADITANTAVLGWMPGGTEALWNLELGLLGFEPGTFNHVLSVTVTNNTFAATGLSPQTIYEFYVQADCGGGVKEESIWAGPFAFITQCMVVTIPFVEGFEFDHINQQALGNCWSQEAITGTNAWTANNTLSTYNRDPRTGSWNAYLRYANNRWMFKRVSLEAETTYIIDVYARQDGANSADASITISYGTESNAASMTNVIVPQTGLIYGNYQLLSGSFTPSVNGEYYIGINGSINSVPWFISIDDISIYDAPSCPAPSALTTLSTSTDGSVVAWTSTATEFEIEYGEAPYAFTGTANVSNIFANSYIFTELDPATTYQYKVKAICGVDDESEWSVMVVSFTTDCETYPLPFEEDFTGFTTGQIPICWNRSHINWGVFTTNDAGGTAPEMLFKISPSQSTTQRLITPLLEDTSGKTDLLLCFNHYLGHWSGPYSIKVQSSPDGNNWTDEWSIVNPTADIGPEKVTVDLSHLLGESFYLAWVFSGQPYNTNGWSIDDIIINDLCILQHIVVDGITIGDEEDVCFDAQNTIIVTNTVVEDGGIANFVATGSILLGEGVVVEQGGYLWARISDAYCSMPISLLASGDLIISEELPAIVQTESFFRVFPNPTAGIVNLQLYNVDEISRIIVEVYTIMGERVLQNILFGATTHMFDLSSMPKGIYIVRVLSGEQIGIEKVIRQ